jgi:methyl-accepting chemotaxis protein
MLKNRRMSTKIFIPIIGSTIILAALLNFFGDTIVSGMIETDLKNMVQSKITDIKTSEDRIAKTMLSQASLFSRAKAVQEAYLIAYEGDINIENDPHMERAREKLRDYFSSIEKGYTKNLQEKNFRIHFHLPPARSLLRLWKKKQNKSDDLSTFRNTIKEISAGNHGPITGIEIGRGGFAIRGIAPVITDNGRYLGSVEALSSYNPVVKYSISNANEFIAVYMNKEFLSIAHRLQNPKKYPVIGDKFVYVSSTNKDITDEILSTGFLDRASRGQFQEKEGKYVVAGFPIKDFSGKQVGVMAYVYNAENLYDTLSKIKWGIVIFSIILLIFIVGPTLFTVRTITTKLNRVTSNLNQGSEKVASASTQVASASQSLAEGASEQAAFIEETSSSLEEMSSLTKQNADNAIQADNLMKETNQVIKKADNAMSELTTSMEDISNASEETQKIIKTIDEVAFQTNLLALNAAVEAARAGEAGAGFAVVADEVRNLAIRAADAAKNTAGLIEDTVRKVNDGSTLVSTTNEAFNEVAVNASKVGEFVGEIAAASNEQAQGIDQINTAVTEMDQVTQQNAANAEESAAASEEMTTQAGQIEAIVGELIALVDGNAKETGRREFSQADFRNEADRERSPHAAPVN